MYIGTELGRAAEISRCCGAAADIPGQSANVINALVSAASAAGDAVLDASQSDCSGRRRAHLVSLL